MVGINSILTLSNFDKCCRNDDIINPAILLVLIYFPGVAKALNRVNYSQVWRLGKINNNFTI